MRLKLEDTYKFFDEISHFNTKKVRLKPARTPATPASSRWFQYQKGAIKTWHRVLRLSVYLLFQYQKGAIKTGPVPPSQLILLHFNTKKVRLKPHRRIGELGTIRNFNTKKVRLKPLLANRLERFESAFQYQKGAIKTRLPLLNKLFVYSISIPKRCD